MYTINYQQSTHDSSNQQSWSEDTLTMFNSRRQRLPDQYQTSIIDHRDRIRVTLSHANTCIVGFSRRLRQKDYRQAYQAITICHRQFGKTMSLVEHAIQSITLENEQLVDKNSLWRAQKLIEGEVQKFFTIEQLLESRPEKQIFEWLKIWCVSLQSTGNILQIWAANFMNETNLNFSRSNNQKVIYDLRWSEHVHVNTIRYQPSSSQQKNEHHSSGPRFENTQINQRASRIKITLRKPEKKHDM